MGEQRAKCQSPGITRLKLNFLRSKKHGGIYRYSQEMWWEVQGEGIEDNLMLGRYIRVL